MENGIMMGDTLRQTDLPEREMINREKHGAVVELAEGGGGYIDRSGELVIRAGNWDIGDAFRGGIAQVTQGDAWGYIDRRGEYIWIPTS